MKLHWQCTEPECERPRQGSLAFCASHLAAQRKSEREASRTKKEVKTIAKVSKKPHWVDSNGDTYSEETVRRMRAATYQEMDSKREHRGVSLNLCDCCGCRMLVIDHDHTIGQAECKNLHKVELIWDERNIEYSCRRCHQQWESYKSGDFRKHKNFERRMAFMKEHDYQGYVKRMEIVELFNRPTETI